MKTYTIKQASELSGLTEKCITNYYKVGREFEKVPRKRIDGEVFRDWFGGFGSRTVTLTRTDYIECIEFAIKSVYAYASSANFGTTTQRDAGKFVTDFVTGKLGELAVARFLEERFDTKVQLDFSVGSGISGQDILQIAPPRRTRVYNPPKLRIAIKTSKIKNVWLIVPRKEVDDSTRASDVYVLARVDLVFDHFLRLVRDHQSLQNVRDTIPEFAEIKAEISGFITQLDLMANPPTTNLEGQNTSVQESYVCRSGDLSKTDDDWKSLLAKL